MQLSGNPVVVNVGMLLPERFRNMRDRFFNYGTSEEGMHVIAQYYAMPFISMRNALWHLFAASEH